jgi:hypothetical protein
MSTTGTKSALQKDYYINCDGEVIKLREPVISLTENGRYHYQQVFSQHASVSLKMIVLYRNQQVRTILMLHCVAFIKLDIIVNNKSVCNVSEKPHCLPELGESNKKLIHMALDDLGRLQVPLLAE